MSGLSRQRFGVLVLILVAIVFALGCSGGEETPSTVAPVTTTASGGSGTNGGELSEDVPLTPTDGSPAEYVDAFGSRPIVVLFYVPGNADDTSVFDTVERLKSSFDRYEFLVYDYKDPDAYGTLSQLLEASYPPYLVLIDGAGYPRKVFHGYVDEGTLNQSLVNLGRL